MFKPADKSELNQVSLTGLRGIVLLGLLIEAPRSLKEIREIFTDLNIFEPEHSDDILRIDINTLKASGCEITKANAKTGFKYRLLKHPFSLNILKDKIHVIKKAYKKIKDSSNIELILKYDELFKKLAEYIDDSEAKETLRGLSVLKTFDTEFIQDLIEDCRQNRTLRLSYRTPQAKDDSQKEVCAHRIVFQNDKIYLYGFDLIRKKSVVLNIKRIGAILARFSGSSKVEIEYTTVKFFLKNFGVTGIEENEVILENRDDGYIIEGRYYNDFLAAQRILSFGANCTVLEPQEFREKIIQKLINMRNVYNE